MNFALPAITLLLLLLPGILAVQGFLGRIGRKTSDPVGQAGLTWAGLVALLIAPVIHLLLTSALHVFGAPPPDLHATLVLLSGRFDDQTEFQRAIGAVIGSAWPVTAYFLAASLLGLIFGSIAQRVVRHLQLDRTFPAFRFASDWHYLFEGEIRSDLPRPDFVVVAVTVEHAGTAYLYVGVLRHYAVDRQGELARLHMNSVVRRPIAEDRAPGQQQQLPDQSGRFYPITGDELVIVFREVRTLNVRYMYLKPRG
ncbi:MAG: hypothetical protein WDO68_20825 [Gammaproteobacteria bacterium]